MTSTSNYRVYCLTEKRYIYTYSATTPTNCPNNGGHSIDSNRVFSILKTEQRYDATSDPTVNNDQSQGFTVGSIWINTNNDKEYVCLDQTTGAAVWKLSTTTAASEITSGTFANARISQSSVTQHEAAINHNALSGFVSNEHINHSSVSINAGEGLSGGGNITSSRTINLDINGLTTDSSPNGAADYVATYDASAGSHKKVLLNNLPGQSSYYYAASEGQSSTTSTSLQTKTTLTTSSLPSGTYRLGYCYEISNASNGVLSEVEVTLDGTVIGLSTFEADNDYHALSGFIHQSLSGVITARIRHRVQSSGTSQIRRARLELQKIS